MALERLYGARYEFDACCLQILDRIQYVLNKAAAPGAFLSLLRILQRIASGGLPYIEELVHTPELLETLFGLLEAPAPHDNVDLLAKATWSAAPDVMQLLAVMCRGGKSIIIFFLSKGIYTLSWAKK